MNTTAALIYAMYERGGGPAMAEFRKKFGVPEERIRGHLGASLIGRECERELWNRFRWAKAEAFNGRMLRLFETGHLEEPRLVANLKDIGIQVHETDPEGGQWSVKAIGDHFGGSMDAALLGVPEAPKTWHVGEFKTASQTAFNDMVKNGVKKSKPEHFAQMQTYMGLTGMDRALYAMKNKNTDALHIERIEFNEDEFTRIMDKAARIINAGEPPPRISADPSYFKCKSCLFYDQCHGDEVPTPNCRTCAHSTPEMGGKARWSCAQHKCDIPLEHQGAGCEEHRYIPKLLGRLGELMEAQNNEVAYRRPDGSTFVNGTVRGAYSSKEIYSAGDKNAIGAADVNAMKELFGARVVE